MSMYPKYLAEYPNMNGALPFHISINASDTGFKPHSHSYMELSLVIAGKGRERINGAWHPMRPGTLTLVRPHDIHEIVAEPGSALQLYNCIFGLHLWPASELAARFDETEPDTAPVPSHVHTEGQAQRTMDALFRSLYDEYRGNGHWRHELLRSKLIEALVMFDRLRRPQTAEAAVGRPGQPETIRRIVRHVQLHFREELTLTSVAETFHCGKSRLSKWFKQATGHSFVGFLHETRLHYACGLLASTDLHVVDVALEAGFGSYKTFSRLFRSHRGTYPLAYRRLHRTTDHP
ncbi:AraC family transcriptional regulator [Paenibacillus cymbidii]|uniref:AraC family transcriptional regulator n=1 Tax=Paenibacillus cymbidii TaxID=1639034 RepID=UPI001436A9E4|nr:AraC family transcriptional regulator [Paenibacillus cymbidii]